MIAACIDAFGAALALGWIDEDAELSAGSRILLLENIEVLVRDGPLIRHRLPFFFVADGSEFCLERRWFDNFAEDRGIRAFGHAVHTANAVFGNEERNIGSNVAEVAKCSGCGRNNAAGYLIVCFESFLSSAVVVSADNSLVEVLDIHDVLVDISREIFNGDFDSFAHYVFAPYE